MTFLLMGWRVIAGRTPGTSFRLEASSRYMERISWTRGTEGLNVEVMYVCLKPVGFTFSSSRVRSVRFAIRIVDVVFGIEVISWKMGGFTVGFAYSTSVDMEKVEFRYTKFRISAASGSEGAAWAKLMRARMREVEVLDVRG